MIRRWAWSSTAQYSTDISQGSLNTSQKTTTSFRTLFDCLLTCIRQKQQQCANCWRANIQKTNRAAIIPCKVFRMFGKSSISCITYLLIFVFTYAYVYLFVYLYTYIFIYPSNYPCNYLSIYISYYLSKNIHIFLSIPNPTVFLPINLSDYPSSFILLYIFISILLYIPNNFFFSFNHYISSHLHFSFILLQSFFPFLSQSLYLKSTPISTSLYRVSAGESPNRLWSAKGACLRNVWEVFNCFVFAFCSRVKRHVGLRL